MPTIRPLFFAISLVFIAVIARGQEANTDTPGKVYRDQVVPHWFADATGQTNQFWYDVSLPDNGREFILVDAAKGTRQPAFDQARVATALSKLLGHPITANSLPVETIEFSRDGRTLALSNVDTSWNLDLQSYAITTKSDGGFGGNILPAGRAINHPSRNSDVETKIKFLNRLKEPVDIFWIDPDGKRVPYGSLQPGESHENHTYAGHVWLVTSAGGNILAVFEAEATAGLAIVDRQTSGRQRRRSENEFRPPPDGTTSPDGKWQAVVRGDNLYLRDLATRNEEQRNERQRKEEPLTYDANPNNTYARDREFERNINMQYNARDQDTPTPDVYWSPDSKYLVAMRLQPGTERRVYEVESSPEDQLQPKLTSYPYLKAGDQVPISKPHLFDVAAKKEISVSDTLFANPWSIDDVRWSPDSSRFSFCYNQRGHQALRILGVKASTGEVNPVVDEESKTFIDYSGKFYVDYLDATGEIIWMSERDGWNHLYLYDAKTGAVKNQITKGQWVVRSVDNVDETKRQIWFQASGIVPGQDPYYIQFCRINFDGSGLTLLTEGDGTHTVQFSPDHHFLIDTWSRVNLPPVNVLRRVEDGGLVCNLETADASELSATGWKMPEPFVARGRDGATDIYGVIWWPKDLDPQKEYPVIEDIYAGPQDSFTPKDFHVSYHQQKLADLGFVVVQMDGMGTSNRSKKFHDVCWKNLRDAGFPDRRLWIKAAAAKYPCMDLTRVGIYGTSAGGQDALRGILDYPDFYKACVADSGCYDNRMDKIWWNEQWMGWPVDESYVHSSCVPDAHHLQGKLLLMVGEADQNVDPSTTMQVVNALIKSDKDFGLLDMPGAGHGVAGTAYGWRRLQEFFVQNLLGEGGSELDSHNKSKP